ncbi:hypothetical protein WA158_005423 [Blastocystis sp. Blastoise]
MEVFDKKEKAEKECILETPEDKQLERYQNLRKEISVNCIIGFVFLIILFILTDLIRIYININAYLWHFVYFPVCFILLLFKNKLCKFLVVFSTTITYLWYTYYSIVLTVEGIVSHQTIMVYVVLINWLMEYLSVYIYR